MTKISDFNSDFSVSKTIFFLTQEKIRGFYLFPCIQQYLYWWGIYNHRYISPLDTTDKEMREKVTNKNRKKGKKKNQEKRYLICVQCFVLSFGITALCGDSLANAVWINTPSHKWEDSDVDQWSDLTRFFNPISLNPRNCPPSTTFHHVVSFSDITQQSFLSSLSWEIAMIDQDTR